MFRKLLSYITFWKVQEDNGNSYLRAMHRINKISILMFLVALVILITRLISSY